MLTKEHLVHVLQIFLYFHVFEFSYSYWFDMIWCLYVNKRDVENETREIIVENMLCCNKCCVVDCRSNYVGGE